MLQPLPVPAAIQCPFIGKGSGGEKITQGNKGRVMESLAEGSLPLTGLHAKEEEEEHKEVKSGCLKKEKKK